MNAIAGNQPLKWPLILLAAGTAIEGLRSILVAWVITTTVRKVGILPGDVLGDRSEASFESLRYLAWATIGSGAIWLAVLACGWVARESRARRWIRGACYSVVVVGSIGLFAVFATICEEFSRARARNAISPPATAPVAFPSTLPESGAFDPSTAVLVEEPTIRRAVPVSAP